jgi:DNA-binding response OmpR family regulator
MDRERILLVEDEKDLAEPLRDGLIEEGFHVEIAPDGATAIRCLVDHWDLVILDLMLPDMSGEAIVVYMRQLPDYPPILVLSARAAIEDKLALFRQGCDDYLTKPVIFEELVEHIRALLRRSHRVAVQTMVYDDMVFNPQTFELSCPTGSVALTPKEASVIRFFISNAERVVSRKELLQNLWGLKSEPETNFIGVHIFNLRKKMSEIGRENWLQTVRNSGFLLGKPR